MNAAWFAELAAEEPDAAAFLPDILIQPEEPSIPLGAEGAWNAFWTLHGDRQMAVQGMGTPMGATIIEPIPMAIPFSSICLFADRMGIFGESFDVLLALVSAMDREFREIEAERSRARWEGFKK